MTMRPAILGLCLALCAAGAGAANPAFAEPPKKAVAKRRAGKGASARRKPAAKKAPEKSAASTSTPPPARDKAPSSAAQAAQREARAGASEVDSEVVHEGDASVKVMRFTGLGIEGRLKSPQLLYFENRVRAEFDRPRLPHRSFMPELERTTQKEPE